MKPRILAALSIILLSALSAQAQTGTQGFTVTIPAVLEITAPGSAATLTGLTGTAVDPEFTPQTWTIAQNSSSGATVNFTAPAFTVNAGTAAPIESRLTISNLLNQTGGAGWTISTATGDSNSGALADATVTAASTTFGGVQVELTVGVVTGAGGVANIAQGDYSTTVTGTITANP